MNENNPFANIGKTKKEVSKYSEREKDTILDTFINKANVSELVDNGIDEETAEQQIDSGGAYDVIYQTLYYRLRDKDFDELKNSFAKGGVVEQKITSLDEIDTSNYQEKSPDDFGQSEGVEKVNPNTISEEENKKANLNLDKDTKSLVNIKEAEKNGTLDTALYTFEEVDLQYNGDRYDDEGNLYAKAITDKEKCAYVKFIEKLHNKDVQGGFKRYGDLHTEKELFKLNELFYDYTNRQVQPKFIFLSGDIPNKLNRIRKNKDEYSSQYGKGNYDKAIELLSETIKELQKNRLKVDDPIISKRLKINIRGEFAKSFQIEQLYSPRNRNTPKLINRHNIYAKKDEYGNTKEILAYKTAPTSRNEYSGRQLTLAQAFFLWVRDGTKSNGVLIKNGLSAEALFKFYFKKGQKPKYYKKDQWLNVQAQAKANTERLFSQFLAEGLTGEDKVRLEVIWNDKYNSYITPDVNKVPIGFQFTRFVGESLENDIRPEKREAIAYYMLRNTGLFAYGVGVGKTWCSIFTMAQMLGMGLTKRPLVIVPKQVYTQFSKEIKTILGDQYPVNTLYNLSKNKDKKTGKTWIEKGSDIKDNTISICTKSALAYMDYTDTYKSFGEDGNDMYGFNLVRNILFVEGSKNYMDEYVQTEQLSKHTDNFLDIMNINAENNIKIDSDKVAFDFLCVDEAHNYKKVFTQVKSVPYDEADKEGGDAKRKQHRYKSLQGGKPSADAYRLFTLATYIQSKNQGGNTLYLTATPFTNKPQEIYSMLALISYKKLLNEGYEDMVQFFDMYADMKMQNVVKSDLSMAKEEVFIGFTNLIALQNLIFSVIDKKGRKEEDKLVERPNKIVLPFKNVMKNGVNYPVAKENRISTTLQMTDRMTLLANELKDYASGSVDFDELCLGDNLNETKFGKENIKQKKKADKESSLTEKELEEAEESTRADMRTLKCLNYFRQLALNPYIYSCSGYKENPTAKEYVEASPKMLYAFECAKSVKDYENENGLPISGQVFYMNIGVDAFPLMLEYAVKNLGYNENEVAYIGRTNSIGKKKYKDKSDVQDAFLGRVFDEDEQEYREIPDNQRVKLLIGSASIREGMNLQFYASCLYNLYIDYNPTDNTQLEGRIWRQGNRFDNVRIVIPLMENSMDIFLFQKLEEKTERINQIWNRDGETNEFNTEDFDPSELKYELITDPIKLAKLQQDEEITKLDNQIDEINLEYSSLLSFADRYELEQDFYKKPNWDGSGSYSLSNYDDVRDTKYFKFYEVIRNLRPDLLDKPFINDEYSKQGIDMFTSFSGNTTLNELRNNNQLDKIFSYSLIELSDLMVQIIKDQKISFPKDYQVDWKERSVSPSFKVGDEVEYTDKRGNTKVYVIDKLNDDNYPEYADLRVGETYVDDVDIDKINAITKEREKLDAEFYEPFDPTLDKNREKVFEWIGYDEYIGNTLSYSYNLRNDLRYHIGLPNYYYFKKTYDFNVKEYGDDIVYKKVKWADLMDLVKRSNYNKSYFSADIPRSLTQLKKAEETILIPQGINNKVELSEKIKELLDQINDLDVQKNALDDEEEINERANLIADELEQQRLLGIRKPSTYSQRAKEFATANEDYLGNDYLKILSAKFLKKQKEAQQKVSKPKDKSDKDYLIKRLKGLQMLAKVNPKDNDLKRRLKGMKMLLKNNYGITRV